MMIGNEGRDGAEQRSDRESIRLFDRIFWSALVLACGIGVFLIYWEPLAGADVAAPAPAASQPAIVEPIPAVLSLGEARDSRGRPFRVGLIAPTAAQRYPDTVIGHARVERLSRKETSRLVSTIAEGLRTARDKSDAGEKHETVYFGRLSVSFSYSEILGTTLSLGIRHGPSDYVFWLFELPEGAQVVALLNEAISDVVWTNDSAVLAP